MQMEMDDKFLSATLEQRWHFLHGLSNAFDGIVGWIYALKWTFRVVGNEDLPL